MRPVTGEEDDGMFVLGRLFRHATEAENFLAGYVNA